MGKVPASPRATPAGPSPDPVHWSSMPPVPKVALARPGRVQPWPTSEACWSPGDPADGRRARQRGRRPDGARGVDDRRQHGAGDPQPLEQRLVPVEGGGVDQRGHGGVGGVGDVQRVGAGGGASRERPGHPGVDRAEAQLAGLGAVRARGRPRRGWPSPWWPRRWGRAGCRRLGAPGRCPRSAGPATRCPGRAALPLARSQTMLEARWLAMPTPATGPPSASAAVAPRAARPRPSASASNSTSPGAGESGSSGETVLVLDGGVGADDGGADARGADVDDQDAAARCAHDQGEGPNGEARPNLPGLRMPLGSNVAFRPCSTSKPVPRARGQEARAVQPDAVVVADGRIVRQGGVDDHVPGLAVVALTPFGIALGPAPAEGEIEARPVGIGVRLVGRRGQRPFDPLQRSHHLLEEARAARPTVPTPPRCRRRSRRATAVRGPRRRCDAPATARRGRRRAAARRARARTRRRRRPSCADTSAGSASSSTISTLVSGRSKFRSDSVWS